VSLRADKVDCTAKDIEDTAVDRRSSGGTQSLVQFLGISIPEILELTDTQVLQVARDAGTDPWNAFQLS
jgi:hypothetical protein